MKALPSGVKVIFYTCFPIAVRAIRDSEFSNLHKTRCRTSMNLRVFRMHDLTASGCELTILPQPLRVCALNSTSMTMRNLYERGAYFSSISTICPSVPPALPRLWVTLAFTQWKSPGLTSCAVDWPSGAVIFRMNPFGETIKYGRR